MTTIKWNLVRRKKRSKEGTAPSIMGDSATATLRLTPLDKCMDIEKLITRLGINMEAIMKTSILTKAKTIMVTIKAAEGGKK